MIPKKMLSLGAEGRDKVCKVIQYFAQLACVLMYPINKRLSMSFAHLYSRQIQSMNHFRA